MCCILCYLDLVALVVGLGGRVLVLAPSARLARLRRRGEQREELVEARGLLAVLARAALVAAVGVAVLVVERGRGARRLTRI